MPRRKRKSRAWRVVLGLVIVAIAFAAVWVAITVNEQPAWYVPPDARNEGTIDLGHATQNRVITQVHRGRRESPEWTMQLTDDEINAWLAVNLPGWIEEETGHTWPDAVTLPVVTIDEAGLTVGMQIPDHFGERIVSARLSPEFVQAPANEEDNANNTDSTTGPNMLLRLDRIALNRFTVPGAVADSILATVRDAIGSRMADDAFDRTVGLLLGEREIEPVLELGDGRRVRIIDLACDDGIVTLTCRTERARAEDDDADDAEPDSESDQR